MPLFDFFLVCFDFKLAFLPICGYFYPSSHSFIV
uniref:Uncharacterized protein n=1 Tax=Anguilla anguilla TaxID=7936 RepID=A0A0E9R8U0_ANGAN